MAKKAKESEAEDPNAREVKITGQQLIDTYRSDQANLERLQKKSQGLQKVISELAAALDSVKGIEKAEKDENILISLGAGVYAEAKIINTKTFKSSLAGNVLVDTEAKKLAESLSEDLKKAGIENTKTLAQMQKTQQNMQAVSQMVQHRQRQRMQESQKEEQTGNVS